MAAAQSSGLAASAATLDLLRQWLSRMLTPQAMQWLDAEIARAEAMIVKKETHKSGVDALFGGGKK